MPLQRQRALEAALGAVVGVGVWLLLGALTGLGKVHTLLVPLVPIAAAVGALLALTRLRAVLWIGASAIGVVAAVVTLTPFTTALLPTRTLVRQDSPPHGALDGIVVLSGGITGDSLLEPEALDRLLTGLALAHDGVAPLLVVTRAHRTGTTGATADRDQEQLRALLTPAPSMLFVDSVRTTRDEAVNAWRLFQQRGVTAPRVAVVTSPLHTRRACASFERVGFAVTCVPATSRAYSVRHASSAGPRLELFRRWLYERAAWMQYRAKGWVHATR